LIERPLPPEPCRTESAPDPAPLLAESATLRLENAALRGQNAALHARSLDHSAGWCGDEGSDTFSLRAVAWSGTC